jgi:cytochrome c556
MSLVRSTAFLLAACGVLAACQPPGSPSSSAGPSPGSADRIAALEEQVALLGARLDELTPETAVLMAQVQTQHAKLYYAGHAKNWELAAYSLHEINEALQAVQIFNDQFEDFPTPLSELVPALVGPPLGEIHAAIRTSDAARFETAFKSLTAACNACHATLKHGFIHVVTPQAGEFTNQAFAAP